MKNYAISLKCAWTYCICMMIGLIITASSVAEAQKVRLRSKIAPTCTASSTQLKYADIFAEGNIAVMGTYSCRGAFIFDISDPDNPVLASWYNPGANQQFLEAIVYNGKGYFGSGTGGGGVHIVDLSNPYNPTLLGTVDSTHGSGHNFIHEMVVFSQGGKDYLIENYNSTSLKTLKIIDVTNPASPILVRDMTPTEPQWVHAMVVVGNRLFTSGWGNSTQRGRTEIYDVTNIGGQAPTLLGYIDDQTGITAGNSMHSSWPSEDGQYLYSARETSNGSGDIRIYNISNPAVPLLVNKLTMTGLGLNAVTPHNPVVKGNYLYVSWYQAGIQIFDLSDPVNPKRVGQYDTFSPQFAPSEAEKNTLATAEPWDLVCGSEFRQNFLPTSYDGNWAVFPALGMNKIIGGDLAGGLYILDATNVGQVPKNQVSDFDGDKKTDISVFSPATGNWWIKKSTTGATEAVNFGLSSDIIQPGDFDGDGKTDQAVYRASTGTWYMNRSTAGFGAVQFGLSGDIPVSADYDADGKTDIAVFRPSNGTWYIQQSLLGFKAVQWGLSGDKPLIGDFDFDGKSDMTVWRPSNGVWYIFQSTSSIPIMAAFGINGDKPLSADMDGNGFADLTVYRPSNGMWYSYDLITNQFRAGAFGLSDDIPVPADYDADGKTDIAVFRPATNIWYRLNSSDGNFISEAFGQNGDDPSPSSGQP